MATPKGRDRKIDPVSRDYISDGNGGYETTQSAETSIYHQIQGHLGKWWGDADAGSEIHTLIRAKSSLRTLSVIRDMFNEALRPLIDDGAITEPVFEQERKENGSEFPIVTSVTVTDLQTGETLDLTSLQPMDP